MNNRNEILSSPEYWIAKTQIGLYNCAESFMQSNGLNRTQLAKHLNVSKGYVSQLLNGDYDHKLSKLIELSLSFGFVPQIDFIPLEDVINEDRFDYSSPKWIQPIYNVTSRSETAQFNGTETYESVSVELNPTAA